MARDIFIKIRATEKEREEWKCATFSHGGISKAVRAHLSELAKRQESAKTAAK